MPSVGGGGREQEGLLFRVVTGFPPCLARVADQVCLAGDLRLVCADLARLWFPESLESLSALGLTVARSS